MRAALQGLTTAGLVLALTIGCSSGDSGLMAAGGQGQAPTGGAGSGGSGGMFMGGGASGSTGGGAQGSGDGGIECIQPPCVAPGCGDGYVLVNSDSCDCSGPCGCPCGCWTCAPVSQSGTGGVAGGTGRVPLQHRAKAEACPSQRGPAPQLCTGGSCAGQPYSAPSTCSSDSQCTAGVNGRCFPWEGLITAGGCSYDECSSDSGCGSKTPCLCRTSATDNRANICDVGGNCAVDSDCGTGGYCSPSMVACYSTNRQAEVEGINYGGPNPYYCHTASDLCLDDSDCAPPDAGTDATGSCPQFTPCAYDVQNHRWECKQFQCCLP